MATAESTGGRRQQTIEEFRIELQKVFEEHPGSHLNDAGETVMPADALVDIFSSLSDSLTDEPLMSGEEVAMFETLLKNNPGLEVSPQIILNFIEEKTKLHPPRSPGNSSDDDSTAAARKGHSRSSSNESNGVVFYPDSISRPPSRGGPQTPASMKSPLDSQRRQRTTPLAAPSSWSTKRPIPSRRKSDAGSRSDSDSHRSGSRTRIRRPSNPTSPSTSYGDLGTFSPTSPPLDLSLSRPHSRAQSQSRNGFSSPDDSTLRQPRSQYGYYNDPFDSSIAMPRTSTSDSDDEEEIIAGLVLDRNNSAISLELHDRLDTLQRANEDLSRKLLEAEKNLQDKLASCDMELDEAQHKLDELRSELSASNREEKDLRTREAKNMTTMASYELEMSTVTKALEQSRATYLSLQKQYQEQCATSEKYRDDLRQREETIRSLKDAATVHEADALKWLREREMYEERISSLERDLEVLSVAQAQLDEQKQQNLFLKEIIDRVRYEMDEMRNAAPGNVTAGGAGGVSSAANSISKSLGAELMGKMKFDMDADDELEEEEEEVEDEDKTEGEEEEEEDVVQTIITKRKRKVASRASVIETRRTFDELKEYSDGATQYDPTLFAVSHSMQTDPPPKIVKSSFSIQTETAPEPKPLLPRPTPRITMEMEIQTEEVEDEEASRSQLESMASSSSTIIPPTPKPQTKALPDHEHSDEPPAYNQITTGDGDWRETLKQWHNGVKIPFEPVEGGISEEVVEDWKALKQELGVECMVIEKILENSERTIVASTSSRLPQEQKAARRSSRFYNIYNTYVYGSSNNKPSSSSNPPTPPTSTNGFSFGFASQAIMLMGASALVLMAATPYVIPNSYYYYSIPGGATYYDRSAWNSFNSMQAAGEGFGPTDGTAAVWNFLGRVGGGAARMARGWPT